MKPYYDQRDLDALSGKAKILSDTLGFAASKGYDWKTLQVIYRDSRLPYNPNPVFGSDGYWDTVDCPTKLHYAVALLLKELALQDTK